MKGILQETVKKWNFIFKVILNALRELSQITFAFFGIFLTTYVPSLHFLYSKLHVFLNTSPTLSANVICESSLRSNQQPGAPSELFLNYQNKHWTIRRWDNHTVTSSSHCIILKIVRFQYSKEVIVYSS